MDALRVEAYAKVNLGLAVLRRREDGYHDIATIFQSVDLADTIHMEPARRISLEVAGDTDDSFPEGADNLAWKAAEIMIEEFGCPGLALTLEKRIPVAAGMGGGSADAAAVLSGANELYGLGADAETLGRLALKLGSDVPFMLVGGTALGQGRGDRLETLPPLRETAFVAVTPAFVVPAAWAYSRVRIGLTADVSFIRVNCSAIREGDVGRLAAGLRNDLEAAVVSACPEIADIRGALLREGAVGAVMSGSGPTVIGLVRDRLEGERIASRLTGRGWTIHVVAPIDVGQRLIARGAPSAP